MTRAAEWTGPVGDVWADEWRRTDRSFAGLAPQLDAAIRAVAPARGSAADIGCGAGATSLALAASRSELRITGIDLSPALVATASDRAAGLSHLSFVAGSVETVLPRLAPVDLLFSRHGVMFFDDPVAGLTTLRGAVAPGAPFVFSCFRAASSNPWASDVATTIAGPPPFRPDGYVPGPFAFADPEFVGDLLAAAGWQSDAPVAVDFRYQAGGGDDPVEDALGFFQRIGPAAPLFRAASSHDRTAMLARLRDLLERHASAGTVDFPAAAWLWTAHAL